MRTPSRDPNGNGGPETAGGPESRTPGGDGATRGRPLRSAGSRAGRPARAVAPWVRTRLRTAPGAAVAMAVLVVLTAYLAAAFPRSVDAYETHGLRHDIRSATAVERVLEVSSPAFGPGVPRADREETLRGAWVARTQRKIVRGLPAPVRADEGSSAYGVRTSEPIEGTDPWLAAPDNLPPMFTLAAQAALDSHSTLREGRLPRADAPVTESTEEVEAAVTAATAKSLHIEVGSVVHVPAAGRDEIGVRITGIVVPRDPDNSYWSFEPTLRSPALVALPTDDRPQPRYWRAALLLPPDAAPVLLATTGEPQLYWRIAPDTDALTARDAPALASRVASMKNGPELTELRTNVVGPVAVVATRLDDIVAGHRSMRAAISPVVAVAALGIGAVAAVVLVMAGGLIAARRQAELGLLRSRGGSLTGIGGRLLAETAVVVLPAAAVGLWLAVLTVPEARLLPAVAAAGAAALLACAALPVRAVVRHRRPLPHGGREDLVRTRPSRRRTIAELTLLALAIGAVVALRRRGTGGASGSAGTGGVGDVDYLVSSAPVLVGLIAALVLVRLYPLPLRLAGRPAGRLRGAVGFLSLARAGRASSSGALPLLALLVALTTAAFGGSVLAGIESARERAAVLATGADARVSVAGTSPALPDGLAAAVGKSSGVDEVTAVRVEYGVPLASDGEDPRTARGVTMIGVEPRAYARLARQTGLGEFSADALKSVGGGGVRDGGPDRNRVLPAIASPAVAERLGDQPRDILSEAGEFKVRVAEIHRNTPAAPGTDYLLVNAADLTQRAPTTLLVGGAELDGAALRRTVAGFGDDLSVKLRTEERSTFVNTPMQEGAERIYAAAIAAGAGYALLALLLSLSQTAPERVTLLARLRTMGLTTRQGRQLLGLEVLPQALLAAVGGALVGWATVVLLAPGVDLVRLALNATSDVTLDGAPLQADPWSLVLPAVGVLALAGAVSVVQAWWAGRQGSINELRAGDSR
ncbi:FtsX-like permease family protein [Streptomyces sp. S4.7]|uniref:FtsX-like permease family protein n=1 Tax=Streptomyces sp. S4.7 TaxID=2705439 RepID=UPI0013991CED|nr:FtsX-like permease family protein [Streptomyces sp. S4.7]QHY95556.1 FtsX-like permease family protein [Streptomyces sp. S4.7]